MEFSQPVRYPGLIWAPGYRGEGVAPMLPALGEALVGQEELRSEWLQGRSCVCVCMCVCLGAGAPLPQRAWWSLQPLPQGIIEAYKNGDIVLGNTTSMGRWEFVGSFFFSVSTITTIGKRRMGPRRGAGEGGLA